MKATLMGLVALAMLAPLASGQPSCAIKVDLRWYLPPGSVIRWPTTGEPMKDLTVIRLMRNRLGETYWQETAKNKYPDICLDAEHADFFVFWSEIPRSDGAMVRVFRKDKSGCVIVPADAQPLFEADKMTRDSERSAKQAFKDTLEFLRARGNQPVSPRVGCLAPEYIENPDTQTGSDKQPQSSSGSLPSANQSQVVLDISSTPPGAEIELDGSFIGSTPSSITTSAGDHTAKITKKGYAPWERKIKTTGGRVSIVAELEAAK